MVSCSGSCLLRMQRCRSSARLGIYLFRMGFRQMSMPFWKQYSLFMSPLIFLFKAQHFPEISIILTRHSNEYFLTNLPILTGLLLSIKELMIWKKLQRQVSLGLITIFSLSALSRSYYSIRGAISSWAEIMILWQLSSCIILRICI